MPSTDKMSGQVQNSENPDDVSALFATTKSIFKERNTIYILEITTCDPSMYTTDHPDLTVSNLVEKSNGLCNILQPTIHV